MHQSFFSYNITRPYPFRWFTPVVIIGGIIAVALLTFLNVAATGYELYAISSDNPNATLDNASWFDKWPSFLVSTNAVCQTSTIPLQTRVYTNNTALPYSLHSVWKLNGDGKQNMSGSLVYNNQPLQDCHISTDISIDINVDSRTGGQMAMLPVGATVTAGVDCAIDEPQGRTFFKLFASYDPVPPPADSTRQFLARNATSKASLYWGESIMRLYWAYLMMEYYTANVELKVPWYNGVVSVKRNSTQAIATADEVKSIDFFHVGCFFNKLNSTGIAHGTTPCLINDISSLSEESSGIMPGIWESVNILGKATYFTVLADLGRSNDAGPNMLADPDLLANLSQNLTRVNQTLIDSFRWGIPDTAKESFDPSQAARFNLGVSPAVLATNYLCQVPKLKSAGTLFVSVLVADLVLLQALWMTLKLIVDTFWIEKKPEWRRCEGCSGSTQPLDELSLVDRRNGSYSEVSHQEDEPR
jgi:hypothetical protein